MNKDNNVAQFPTTHKMIGKSLFHEIRSNKKFIDKRVAGQVFTSLKFFFSNKFLHMCEYKRNLYYVWDLRACQCFQLSQIQVHTLTCIILHKFKKFLQT